MFDLCFVRNLVSRSRPHFLPHGARLLRGARAGHTGADAGAPRGVGTAPGVHPQVRFVLASPDLNGELLELGGCLSWILGHKFYNDLAQRSATFSVPVCSWWINLQLRCFSCVCRYRQSRFGCLHSFVTNLFAIETSGIRHTLL